MCHHLACPVTVFSAADRCNELFENIASLNQIVQDIITHAVVIAKKFSNDISKQWLVRFSQFRGFLVELVGSTRIPSVRPEKKMCQIQKYKTELLKRSSASAPSWYLKCFPLNIHQHHHYYQHQRDADQ